MFDLDIVRSIQLIKLISHTICFANDDAILVLYI